MTYAEVMKMNEGAFLALVVKNNAQEWMKKAVERKEERRTYPRKPVLDTYGNPVKRIGKTGKEFVVMEADYSRKPSIKHSPISFFSIKKAFCEEVLGIEKKQPEYKDTFRERTLAFLEEMDTEK